MYQFSIAVWNIITKRMARAAVSLEAGLRKDLLPSSRGCWQHSAPCGTSDWGLSCLMADGCLPPSAPCHVDLPNTAACFLKAGKGKRGY